jgi:hypothetical protein
LERVAGFLEVWRNDDSQEIVVKSTDFKRDANGASLIVLSPRHARHLSNVLITHAEEIEEARRSMNRSVKSR